MISVFMMIYRPQESLGTNDSSVGEVDCEEFGGERLSRGMEEAEIAVWKL